jgi:dynein heavy chain
MKNGLTNYAEKTREEMITKQCGQIVIAIFQIEWAKQVEHALSKPDNRLEALKGANEETESNINNLAAVVRTDLTEFERTKNSALITINVHNRDIVSEMIQSHVNDINSFDWFKRLKYKWDECKKEVIVNKQTYNFRMVMNIWDVQQGLLLIH